VSSADAFVLTPVPDVLASEFGYRVWDSVTVSITRWARRLLWLGANQQMNPWLDTFDMQVSSHKLFPPDWNKRPGRAGILRVDEQPAGLSLGGLFDGVEQIRIASPWLLRTGSIARPLLACPPETDIVDRGDRFLMTDDPGRVCAGYWAPGPEAPPRVLVFGAACFHDGGLDENFVFAKNTIEWLVGHDWSSTVTERAGRYVEESEVTLRELIETALRRAVDGAWFDEVPVDVRRSIEGRRSSADSRLEPYDYATLGDLIKVVRGKWDLFDDIFAPRPKDEVVSSLRELNDIRNRLSHPPRARKEPPSEDDLASIMGIYELLTTCLQRARGDVG
jgi:hypothetical protein